MSEEEKNSVEKSGNGPCVPCAVAEDFYDDYIFSVGSPASSKAFWAEDEESGLLNEGFEITGSTAVVNIAGYLTRSAYIPADSSMYNYTGMEQLVELCSALNSRDDIDQVAFMFNTPGGGVPYLYQGSMAIANIRHKTIALVDEMACSGGMMLISQCDEIAVTPTSEMGSVGVITAIPKKDDDYGYYAKVRSPNAQLKQPHSANEEMVSDVVRMLSSLETVLIDTVASGRGVDRAKVIDNFGKGGIIVGVETVERGMADYICQTKEEFFKKNGIGTSMDENGQGKPGVKKDADQTVASNSDGAVQAAVEAERTRIIGIVNASGYEVPEALVGMISDPDETVEKAALKAVGRLKTELAAARAVKHDKKEIPDAPEGKPVSDLDFNSPVQSAAQELPPVPVRKASPGSSGDQLDDLWASSEEVKGDFDCLEDFKAWASRNKEACEVIYNKRG